MSKRLKDLTVVTVFGFASGLPFPLIGGTLQAWLASEGVDIKVIGLLTALTLPYSFKFFWSAFFDRFEIPKFGRRRGWILICQIMILFGLFLMIFFTPKLLLPFIFASVLVAFFSASQDISIDAYRTEMLLPKDRGLGASLAVTAYRVALVVAGGLCLLVADRIGWSVAVLLVGSLLTLGILTNIWADEPMGIKKPDSLKESFIEPFRDLIKRDKSIFLLFFIMMYKLGDAYAGSLSTAFFIRGIGFSLTEVGSINKIIGLVSAIVGSLLGGVLMRRMTLFNALFLFGVFQALSNLMFLFLALIGKNFLFFVFTVVIENLTGGMGTTAFLALLMSLCNRSFAATQYAVLSSVASLGRVFINPTSGFVVDAFGWQFFYLISFFVALPSLALVFVLRKVISENS
ncbi:MAG: MFS transporter [Thermodesulfovibrio sp.]|nr:MFS transporter [Thermodesulfovibrio sp.]